MFHSVVRRVLMLLGTITEITYTNLVLELLCFLAQLFQFTSHLA